MTRDDILTMASESYCWRINLYSERTASLASLERFAELVAAAEREACAKRLDAVGCDHCAENIRLRGKE